MAGRSPQPKGGSTATSPRSPQHLPARLSRSWDGASNTSQQGEVAAATYTTFPCRQGSADQLKESAFYKVLEEVKLNFI